MRQKQDMIQMRWHSRGGQGAKTAADFFTQVAISEGKYSQAFPEYGPERSGAPMRSYTRVSSKPINLHSAVYTPDVVIIVDPTLIATVDVWDGLLEDGTILINTHLSPEEARRKFNIRSRKVFTIDATKISLEELGRNIPNMPMVGALVKVTGLLQLDHVIESLRKTFSGKFGKDVVEKNIRAINRAYNEVRAEGRPLVSRATSPSGTTQSPPPQTDPTPHSPGWRDLPLGAKILQGGNSIEYETGSWRTFRPVVDKEKCINCLRCWLLCPDASVFAEDEQMRGFDYDHCKGCGICAEMCPAKAIEMILETEKDKVVADERGIKLPQEAKEKE